MKALSIRQPWAWLIVHGYKPVENRTWRTHFRGQFLIHASAGMTRSDYTSAKDLAQRNGVAIPRELLEFGGIVGMANLTDCHSRNDGSWIPGVGESPWFFGPYGFVLRDAKPLPFRPLPGKLGFFEVTP